MILCREKIDPAAGVKSLRFNRRRQGRIDENVIRSNMFQVRQNRCDFFVGTVPGQVNRVGRHLPVFTRSWPFALTSAQGVRYLTT